MSCFFWARLSDLMLASRLLAELRSWFASLKMILTGLLPLKYLAPLLPFKCSVNRLSISVVMPV